MAQSFDGARAESPRFELEEIGRSIRSSFRLPGSISRTSSNLGSAREGDDEYELHWAAIERLPTFDRVRKAVLDQNGSSNEEQKKKVADVTKLGALERRLLIEKLIKHIENDNLRLLVFSDPQTKQSRDNQELVKQLSQPLPDSSDLHFPTRFPQNGWGQFKACLWKQYLSYWRSPSYNLMRMIFIIVSSTVFAILF